MDRRFGVVSVLMQDQTIVVRKELSRKVKLLMYRSVHVPLLRGVPSTISQTGAWRITYPRWPRSTLVGGEKEAWNTLQNLLVPQAGFG